MHLFYRLPSPAGAGTLAPGKGDPPAPWREVFWHPQGGSVVPPQSFSPRFLVWWAFHQLRVFYNRDYVVFLMFDGHRLVHRSCIFPGFFRFPFMGRGDVQIGDTWTHPDLRGKGLATHALHSIVARLAGPGRSFWYVVDAANQASIRAVEKAGFQCVGTGRKRPRAGVRMLGYYTIESETTL